MREFTIDFWRTMPVEVSPRCSEIVNMAMYAIAGQIHQWEADAFVKVVQRTRAFLIRESVSTDPNVIPYLDWLECRDLMFWGLDNRQHTPQELTGLREIEARKAKAEREWAEYKAKQKRDMEEFQDSLRKSAAEGQRVVDQCRAGGGTWLRSKNRCYTQAESDRNWRKINGE